MASWQRWIPLTGILFVVLAVIGFVLASPPDSNNVSDQKILDWYNDSGHQTSQIVGAYFVVLSGVAMLLFLNRLRAVIAEAEGARPLFAPFIQTAGAIFVAGLSIGIIAVVAVSGELTFGDSPELTNADLGRFLPSIGFGSMLIAGMFPFIFAMLTTAYASMRYKIFASWFNWLTVVCGIVLVFAGYFIPLIALGVWMIVASLQLMKHQPAMAS